MNTLNLDFLLTPGEKLSSLGGKKDKDREYYHHHLNATGKENEKKLLRGSVNDGKDDAKD